MAGEIVQCDRGGIGDGRVAIREGGEQRADQRYVEQPQRDR